MEDPVGLWMSFFSAPDAQPPALAHLTALRLDLPTMHLQEWPRAADGGVPVLIVGPFALHDSSIADFAHGHSLAAVLAETCSGPIALTRWKSATRDMANFGVDRYFSDLNVAIDDLGGAAALVGICQGGWLAAAYAARFPEKVRALVLAGAPLDTQAAPSQITQSLAVVPPVMLAQMLRAGGGRLLGKLALSIWGSRFNHPFDAHEALQSKACAALIARANDWHAWAVDLPGVYFLQSCEWVFRENRLAAGSFPVLGRACGLSDIRAPAFLLCAAEDEIIPPPQTLALKTYSAGPVDCCLVPGRHLALFLGQRSLATGWHQAAAWLAKTLSADAPQGSASRSAKLSDIKPADWASARQ